ncbi:MAG: AAA family ATPase [Deltaproteobacteria bacterium]|nr:AAA family ATPase [Deltaproteobacteria bacterium]
MRIAKLEIKDFRAFPGPGTYIFDLVGGKNLLIYGENGSGKSSLFYALAEFFNLNSKARPFSDYKNIFSDSNLTDGHITIHFDDGQSPCTWPFGGLRSTGEPRVAGTALRKGCLDYRALLRTNFVHGQGKVNLFELVVEDLLVNYPVPSGGRATAIGRLWQQVVARKPANHRGRNVQSAQTACNTFNQAVAPAWPSLFEKAKELLATFPGCGVDLNFEFPGVTYDEIRRELTQKELNLEVSLNGRQIPEHQHFLNEARLSAIALSLYLAGLLISIPSPVPDAPVYPKLLVLDDVLVGLDMANRMPVLEILGSYFADWQILLLTHDKVWYEIVRMQTEATQNWCYHELYLGTSPDGYELPVHRGHGESWSDLLKQARKHLADNDERAAAVYARAAFERKLQKYCEDKKVPVRYQSDPRRVTAEWLWDAIKKQLQGKGKLVAHQSIISRIETYRKIVLNPLSHATPTTVTRVEIQGAIDAVVALSL